MSTALPRIAWEPREPPLPPEALLVEGEQVAELVGKLAGRADLRAVFAPGLLLVVASDLPWIDGGRWLGRDPRALQLYLPTTEQPDLPIQAVESAVSRLAGGPAALVGRRVIPLRGIGEIDAETLAERVSR